MAKKISNTAIVTGEVRLSYPNLLQPRASEDGAEPKYSVCVLIPKTDTETVQLVRDAMKAALNDGVAKVFGGKKPAKLTFALRDGDAELADGTKTGEEYAGHYFFNASAKRRPQVVDRRRNNVTDEEEIYGGMYAKVSVNFYAYSAKGNNGVAAGLNGVLKTRDGERLGNSSNVFSDFADDFEVGDEFGDDDPLA